MATNEVKDGRLVRTHAANNECKDCVWFSGKRDAARGKCHHAEEPKIVSWYQGCEAHLSQQGLKEYLTHMHNKMLEQRAEIARLQTVEDAPHLRDVYPQAAPMTAGRPDPGPEHDAMG